MFALLRKAARPKARGRRIMSGLCAAFVLATIAFSSLLLSAEADHDCCGHDCPVCQDVRACVENFELMGSSPGGTTEVSAPAVSQDSGIRVVCAYHAPAATLYSLDVRFDE